MPRFIFSVLSDSIPGHVLIHPGYRYDTALPEYLNQGTNADYDHQTGNVGAYRLSTGSVAIKTITETAETEGGCLEGASEANGRVFTILKL